MGIASQTDDAARHCTWGWDQGMGSKVILASKLRDGRTPLYMASENGHLEVVHLLSRNGADLDKADKTQATPMFVAAAEGHVEIVRLLCNRGAEKDHANKNGETPIWNASLR